MRPRLGLQEWRPYWTAITSCPSACSAVNHLVEARAVGPDAVTENDAWLRLLGHLIPAVIIGEKLIEEAKIAAIRERTNVSRVVEELLAGWLANRKTQK
jgi:hypothetical protein